MNAFDINKYIIEEMGSAEEKGEDVTVRLYLSNSEIIEIWFDKENDYYTWSNASYGYEDTLAITNDIFEWLHEESLSVVNMETI